MPDASSAVWTRPAEWIVAPEGDEMPPRLSFRQAVQPRPDVLFVRGPGCGASATFTTAHPPRAFGHEDNRCPVLQRVQATMTELERAIEAEVRLN